MTSFDLVLEKYFPSVFGMWQLALLCTLIPAIQQPLVMFGQLGFLAPDHRCRQPALERLNWTFDAITNLSVPAKDPEQAPRVGQSYEPCHEFNLDAVMPLITNNMTLAEAMQLRDELLPNLTLRSCAHGVAFDMNTAPIERGLSVDFNLVCERQHLGALSNSLYFIGMLFGFFVSGSLSDNFGRRLPCLVTLGLTQACSLASCLSGNIWAFLVLRMLTACFFNTAFVIGNIMIAELAASKGRTVYTTARKLYLNLLGRPYLVFATYFFQDWRWAYVVFAAPLWLFLPGIWAWIESPRWLIARGRLEEAETGLLRLLKRNRRPLRPETTQVLHEDIHSQALVMRSSEETEKRNAFSFEIRRLLRLLRSSYLRPRMIVCTLLFTLTAYTYYGITFYAVRLKGNPFVIAILVGLMGVPGTVLQFVTFRLFDRKRPFIVYMAITTALFALGAIFLATGHRGVPVIVASTVAVSFLDALFAMIYIRLPELFPPRLRGSALGLAGSVARFGSIIATQVERLDEVWPPLPLMLFALGAAGAAVTACFLPPGKGEMEDVEQNAEDIL